ncbi:hypothetical protein LK994_09110 [Ferruginibacter lapsinanis]|uniref:hypothetical protein n=1 Tax=Ferruginibacter lapsinanis TaxID=563172 RepID=UPI001E43E28A|nr:hypothetical protein [Ferruginibacter lapsinanis]UEG48794.1 hypothetical protein LK994_09110 [Ferruginibacter lapsinanis]
MFIRSIWCNLLLSKTFGVSNAVIYQANVYYSGYLLGMIEVALGIGLLIKRFRKVSLILLIVMHIIILGVFGPVGLNYDHIIWPWNLSMLGYLIFFTVKNNNIEFITAPLKLYRNIPMVILLGVMPIFSLFGRWDFFLSFSLFSSRPTDMYICMKRDINNPLNQYCDTSQTPCDKESLLINVRKWAFKEMYAPAYPQTRVYEKIKNKLQYQFPNMQATYFIYIYRNGKKVKEEMK